MGVGFLLNVSITNFVFQSAVGQISGWKFFSLTCTLCMRSINSISHYSCVKIYLIQWLTLGPELMLMLGRFYAPELRRAFCLASHNVTHKPKPRFLVLRMFLAFSVEFLSVVDCESFVDFQNDRRERVERRRWNVASFCVAVRFRRRCPDLARLWSSGWSLTWPFLYWSRSRLGLGKWLTGGSSGWAKDLNVGVLGSNHAKSFLNYHLYDFHFTLYNSNLCNA